MEAAEVIRFRDGDAEFSCALDLGGAQAKIVASSEIDSNQV